MTAGSAGGGGGAALLVTGGRGALALAVLGALAELGGAQGRASRVLGGARARELVAAVGEPGLRAVAGDPTSAREVAEAARAARADTLVHLGHLSFLRDPENPALYLDAVDAALRGAARGGVRRVVYVSSLLALGPSEAGDEDTLHDAIHFHGPVERIAWDAARVAGDLARAHDLDLVTLFPAFLYGPGAAGPENPLGALAAALAAGRLRVRVGDGGRRLTVCHVEDAAGAIAAAALAAGAVPLRERYLLAGQVVTADALLDGIAAAGGWRAPRGRIGCSSARAVVALRRRNPHLRLLNEELIEALRHDWVYCSEGAGADLGFRTRELEPGLRQAFACWREGGPAAAPVREPVRAGK